MKKLLTIYLLAGCLVLSCSSQKGTKSVSYSSDGNGSRGQHSISIDDLNGSLEIKYSGDIIFNDEETGIKSISPAGYLKFKRNGKMITAAADANGRLMYAVNGGDEKPELNDKEAMQMANAIKTLIAYGIGAKERVAKIYNKGGSTAVLNEVQHMNGDYVKSIYLDYLLETKPLNTDELTEIADKTATLVESDFEKSKLLKKFSGRYLTNPATTQAYFRAVESIGADFEKANALKSILNEPLAPAQFTDVLEVVKSIGSDFEKANVLKVVLRNKIPGEQFSELLKATATISSDFEKANIIKEIIKNGNIPENRFNETLAAIDRISSDFEKANVLKLVAASDIATAQQWLNLINATANVSSDFEKSNILVNIASKMPADDEVRSAYLQTAKTLSSDFEYGKAVKAVK